MSEQSSAATQPFQQLAPGIGTGHAPTSTWQPIAQCQLLIFVGVTGVGKSTTLDALAARLPFSLLPDRRVLTDDLIIAYLQQQAGEPIAPVTDRAERFALTRRYRTLFPGGMGYALSRLLVNRDELAPERADRWLVFDGLRGVNEVAAAVAELPDARFVVLDAPDVVRVQRLLGRGDQFDQVTLAQESSLPTDGTAHTFAEIGLPDADALFASHEVATLFNRCEPPLGQGSIPIDDLRAKLKIVTEERKSYDPTATMATLQQLAPDRTVVIDTTKVSAKKAAAQITAWLSASTESQRIETSS